MGETIGWKRGEEEDVKKGEGNVKQNYSYVVIAV
jgi:hypothetical protein